jgi:DNA polymerase-3 subunit gamma/tau
MATLLQEMAVVQAVPGALPDDDPDSEVARRLAALLPADETQLLYSIVLAGRAEIALAPDEYSGLVMVLLRMLAFAPADARATPTAPPTPVPAPAAAPRATTSAAASASVPASVAPPAKTTATPPARPTAAAPARPTAAAPTVPATAAAAPVPTNDPTATSIGATGAADLWTALVQRLAASGAITAMVRELAMQAECIRVVDGASGRSWQLRVERENLRAPALRERLQAALAQVEGRSERIEIEAGAVADTPAARDAAERDRRQAEAERVIQDDPLVKALMAQYKTARIVPGSVRPPPAPTP